MVLPSLDTCRTLSFAGDPMGGPPKINSELALESNRGEPDTTGPAR